MKAVQAKDLIVGAIYSDTEEFGKGATILKYKGYDMGFTLWEILSGPGLYGKTKGDFVYLMPSSVIFYPLSPSEIEQYLPSLSTDRDGLAITSEDQ